jgi:hypothetical protein
MGVAFVAADIVVAIPQSVQGALTAYQQFRASRDAMLRLWANWLKQHPAPEQISFEQINLMLALSPEHRNNQVPDA